MAETPSLPHRTLAVYRREALLRRGEKPSNSRVTALGEGEPVEIDIARNFQAGHVTLVPAVDPKGARMRKGANP